MGEATFSAVPASRRRWGRSVLLRAVLGLVVYPIVAVAVAGLYLTLRGFPPIAREWVRDAAARRGFAIEFDDMRLDPGYGIAFENVRLFARGVLGPPLVTARELGIEANPLARDPAARLRGIRIRNGRLREDAGAAMFRGAPDGGAPGTAAPARLRIELSQCELQRLPVSRLFCDYRSGPDGMRIENIRGVVGRGERSGSLSGSVHIAPDGSYRGRIRTQLDPYELIPFLLVRNEDGLVDLIRTFAFPAAPPHVEVAVEKAAGPEAGLRIRGRFTADNFRRHDVAVTSAEGSMDMEFGPARRTVSIRPLTVVRPEGRAQIGFTVDMRNRRVQFDGTAAADPRAVAEMIVSGGGAIFRDFAIRGRVECRARGDVSLTDPADGRVDATVRAWNFGFPDFVAEECRFGYRRVGTTTHIDNLMARALEGTVTGSVTIAAAPTGTAFRVAGHLEDANLRRVLETVGPSFRPPPKLAGRITGDLALEGVWARQQERTLNGRCEFRIREGTLFELPLFGGMSESLVGSVPGLGYVLRQTDARAAFLIKDGVARCDDFRIEGDVLSLKADGTYDLLTRRMDFDVELRFLKKKTWVGEIVQTIFLPVTKLFRVRLQGSPETAAWRSVNF